MYQVDEYVPALQRMHGVLLPVVYVPGPHAMHCDDEVKPGETEYDPVGQERQNVES